MLIKASPKFEKQYKRLPAKIKEQAEVSLKTHKLSGKDKGCWAFWINYSYRIKFVFISSDEVLFLEVGQHNIYK